MPAPLLGELLQAGGTDLDERELGRDEKSVRQYERENACQAPEDPSERVLHDVILRFAVGEEVGVDEVVDVKLAQPIVTDGIQAVASVHSRRGLDRNDII